MFKTLKLKDGFIFQRGSTYGAVPHEYPEATSLQWDSETLTATWSFAQGAEGNTPDDQVQVFSQEELDAMEAQAFADPTVTEDDVKAEAYRRIVAILPEWRQRNYIARDLEFTKITDSGGTLTTEQQAERAAIEGYWAEIKAIRTASNALEAMDTIPVDYKNIEHWA